MRFMLTTLIRGGKHAHWQNLAEMLHMKAGVKEDTNGANLNPSILLQEILTTPPLSIMVKFATWCVLIVGDVTREVNCQAGQTGVPAREPTWASDSLARNDWTCSLACGLHLNSSPVNWRSMWPLLYVLIAQLNASQHMQLSEKLKKILPWYNYSICAEELLPAHSLSPVCWNTGPS